MAESISRALRDGALEGGYAPPPTVEDSISSPFAFDVFTHFLAQLSSNILTGKSQPRGIVAVAFYVDLLKRRGSDPASSKKWDISQEVSSEVACLCKDLRDLDKLYSSIIEQGTGLSGRGKEHFSVAIDSMLVSLQLSEKERIERANVVLPFGKLQTSENTSEGEIIYFRDSDDEMPEFRLGSRC
ncbi:hypothetical protein HS088_TW03G00487 [Tripterygium wilfordii]|uniref:Elongator complex protein 5 n=1 Tax=Tripterygium wilfordii TaxID=458696 RepID=A0A7J7DUW5_TRIWF|nr:hypothetical protein HS088_TW03G00487 [Tripterygium wilfordii]